MRQTMYHKARDMLRKAKFPKEWVRAKLFWKDGTEMTSAASRCLMKSKSDNTTHLLWKTIPVKLRLQKGEDGKETGKFFLKRRRRRSDSTTP